MYVSTIITENDQGETRPLTSEANKKNGINRNIREF